nr:putative reverse transcriptase domain-containing protein [Tanacetum cinerariifolium]
QETTEKIDQIKQRMQAARDQQKSYADLKRKPIEFQVRDKVMLKVSPWKRVVRFGKRGKLNPRSVCLTSHWQSRWMKYSLMINSTSLKNQSILWIVKSSSLRKAVFPSSRFDRTLGEALSSHGNVKINSGRSICTSS